MFDETVCSIFPIDKNYYLWLTYTTESGQVWYIVSDKQRTEYFLFKGKRKTAKKATNPLELYKHIERGD